jgi:ABC-type methionine transport system ATPase subunit
MSRRKLRLSYPPPLLQRPIIHKLIRQFDISINILRAQIDLNEGWLEIEMEGSPSQVSLALKWLESEGVEVEGLEKSED